MTPTVAFDYGCATFSQYVYKYKLLMDERKENWFCNQRFVGLNPWVGHGPSTQSPLFLRHSKVLLCVIYWCITKGLYGTTTHAHMLVYLPPTPHYSTSSTSRQVSVVIYNPS